MKKGPHSWTGATRTGVFGVAGSPIHGTNAARFSRFRKIMQVINRRAKLRIYQCDNNDKREMRGKARGVALGKSGVTAPPPPSTAIWRFRAMSIAQVRNRPVRKQPRRSPLETCLPLWPPIVPTRDENNGPWKQFRVCRSLLRVQ